MSDKQKWSREAARSVALELVQLLGPYCERIEIAGSIRRLKPQVSDIEILYVGKLESRPEGLFDKVDVNLADERIEELLKQGVLEQRQNKIGSYTWGPQNKLAVHRSTSIPVDLFATTLEKWFVSLVIRTGSKETNLRLTTGAQQRNRTLHAYGCGVEDKATGQVIRAKSEADVFACCGVPYLPPEKR